MAEMGAGWTGLGMFMRGINSGRVSVVRSVKSLIQLSAGTKDIWAAT